MFQSVRERNSGEELRIDMAPLMDVVFILLLFFLVSASFVQHEVVDLSRPESSQGAEPSGEPVRVTITAEGQYFVGDLNVEQAALSAAVARQLTADRQHVLIVLDQGVPSGELVRAMDACVEAGAKETWLSTDAVGSR